MESLRDFLAARSEAGLVSLAVQREARRRFGLSLRETEEQILSLDLLPARYARNRKTFSAAQQRTWIAAKAGFGPYGTAHHP